MIAANSSTTRLAPPTSAPSIRRVRNSGTAVPPAIERRAQLVKAAVRSRPGKARLQVAELDRLDEAGQFEIGAAHMMP